MFAGHLGIAYLGKSARRDVPLVLLAASAYVPDLVRLVLDLFDVKNELLTHSIPAVLVLAALISVAYVLGGGIRGGAVALSIVCLTHWPADIFTGCKPTFSGGPWIGLIAYRYPVTDLVVELSLLWAGWSLCRRKVDDLTPLAFRWIAPAIATCFQLAFLASLYAGSEFFIGNREWTWHPSEGITTLRRMANTEELTCREPR